MGLKVTRQGHVSGLHAIDFLDQKTLELKISFSSITSTSGDIRVVK